MKPKMIADDVPRRFLRADDTEKNSLVFPLSIGQKLPRCPDKKVWTGKTVGAAILYADLETEKRTGRTFGEAKED
jgi:hypothetical protein